MQIRGCQLWREPKSAHKMFRDRAQQFHDRLKWEVSVDEDGYEIDQYDSCNALYLIIHGPGNPHLGSMRLMPTSGETMLNDHFPHLLPSGSIRDPQIWECTRFCLARDAEVGTSRRLVSLACLALRQLGAKELVAVYDKRMLRIYKLLGIEPSPLISTATSDPDISVGSWKLEGDGFNRLCIAAMEEQDDWIVAAE